MSNTYRSAETSNKLYFDGNREIAIQRDGEKCVMCSMTRAEHKAKYGFDITVDHIDGKGRYTPKAERNNNLDNLQTLCVACHSTKDRKRGGFTKLTEEDVRDIRLFHSKGIGVYPIAKVYHVTNGAIYGITTGKSWKWLA